MEEKKARGSGHEHRTAPSWNHRHLLMVSRGEEGLRVLEDVVICVLDVGLNCFACFCIGKSIKFEDIP